MKPAKKVKLPAHLKAKDKAFIAEQKKQKWDGKKAPLVTWLDTETSTFFPGPSVVPKKAPESVIGKALKELKIDKEATSLAVGTYMHQMMEQMETAMSVPALWGSVLSQSTSKTEAQKMVLNYKSAYPKYSAIKKLEVEKLKYKSASSYIIQDELVCYGSDYGATLKELKESLAAGYGLPKYEHGDSDALQMAAAMVMPELKEPAQGITAADLEHAYAMLQKKPADPAPFFIAGLVYGDFDVERLDAFLRVGTKLVLSPKWCQQDPNAIQILIGSRRLGWVPREQTAPWHRIIGDKGTLEAAVRQFIPSNPPHRRVMVGLFAPETILPVARTAPKRRILLT